MKLKQADLYIRSMGRLLKIEAYFGCSLDDVADANALMHREPRLALVAEVDGLILLADKYDKGLRVAD